MKLFIKNKSLRVKAGEFAAYDEDFSLSECVLLTGARGAGKSYPAGRWIAENVINKGRKVLYLRISKLELPTADSWFAANVDGQFTYARGWPSAGSIYRVLRGAAVGSSDREEIGKVLSLENSALMKSADFSDYDCLVFEEYSRKGLTVEQERNYVFNFFEAVETVFRNRPKKVFLISNALSSMPLLERQINKLGGVGKVFKNAVHYSIYRATKRVKNDLADYMDGETYQGGDIKVKEQDMYPVLTYKKHIIFAHKILSRRYFIRKMSSSELGIEYTKYARQGLLELAKNLPKCRIDYTDAAKDFLFENLDSIQEEAVSVCAAVAYAKARVIVKAKEG